MNKGLGLAVCGRFGFAAFLQIVSFVTDCVWVDTNVMAEEAVNAEFARTNTTSDALKIGTKPSGAVPDAPGPTVQGGQFSEERLGWIV
jgi:hypothetical protein